LRGKHNLRARQCSERGGDVDMELCVCVCDEGCVCGKRDRVLLSGSAVTVMRGVLDV
jgi:hypothetical protein